jgi:hypothetical protein
MRPSSLPFSFPSSYPPDSAGLRERLKQRALARLLAPIPARSARDPRWFASSMRLRFAWTVLALVSLGGGAGVEG